MSIISHTLEQIDGPLPWGATINIECDHCKKPFSRLAKLLRGNRKRGRLSDHFFCSRRCTNEAKKRAITGFNCAWCEKKVDRNPSSRCAHSFCSLSCSAKFTKNSQGSHSKAKTGLVEYHRKKGERRGKPPRPSSSLFIGPVAPKTPRSKPIILTLKCGGCGKDVQRRKSELLKSKHGIPYCTKSCRMKHYNENILKPSSCHRSKAEDILLELIRHDFPTLDIKPNNRDVVPGGLEIDIYLPTLKLAIELNGPVHYLPIYGEERLESVKNKDARKCLELQQLGITQLTFDISHLQTTKKTDEFMRKHYIEYVLPLIRGAPEVLAPSLTSL